MDLNKSYDFFKPEECGDRLHIIGCGAIGSTLAENLARLGLTKMTLYDFDIVEPHNIANQMYRTCDIGKAKVDALAEMLTDINPDIAKDLRLAKDGYKSQKLSGYVFLCVDDIDLRREITQRCRASGFVKAVFDFRMRLTDAQHYAADCHDAAMMDDLINSMAFTNEEARAETPVSACNMTLSVAPTVRAIVALGAFNFINYVQGKPLHKFMFIDAAEPSIVAF